VSASRLIAARAGRSGHTVAGVASKGCDVTLWWGGMVGYELPLYGDMGDT
jgi:hypothetical protein